MEGPLLFLALLFAYFLPTMLASWRKHPQEMAISVLNLFLGWTVLGWIVALIWSVTAVPPKPVPEEKSKAVTGGRRCPWCGTSLFASRLTCPECGKMLPPVAPTRRPCPHCFMEIDSRASVCGHCRRDISPTETRAPS